MTKYYPSMELGYCTFSRHCQELGSPRLWTSGVKKSCVGGPFVLVRAATFDRCVNP